MKDERLEIYEVEREEDERGIGGEGGDGRSVMRKEDK